MGDQLSELRSKYQLPDNAWHKFSPLWKSFSSRRPSKILEPHSVVSKYIEQPEKLLYYLEQAKCVEDKRRKSSLSIFKLITFKLGDTFPFIIACNERHMQQAKRNL
jgi:hypothetical protein